MENVNMVHTATGLIFIIFKEEYLQKKKKYRICSQRIMIWVLEAFWFLLIAGVF